MFSWQNCFLGKPPPLHWRGLCQYTRFCLLVGSGKVRPEWRIKQSAGSTSGGTRTSGARAARSAQEAGRPKAETSWPKMEGRRARAARGPFLLRLNQLEWISPSYNPRAGVVGWGLVRAGGPRSLSRCRQDVQRQAGSQRRGGDAAKPGSKWSFPGTHAWLEPCHLFTPGR